MAIITYNVPISSYDISLWEWGIYTVANSTHLRITDGRHTLDSYGSFTYANNDLSSGLVNSISWSEWGQTYLTIAGVNGDLSVWASAIDNGQGSSIGTGVFDGNDIYLGSTGYDDFYTYLGNDSYDGGAGIDTVHYSYVSNDGSGFAAAPNGSGYIVTGGGKTDTLVNVERIDFGDGSTLALDVKAGENTGAAYRLYQAAFDRKPDTGGLNYWVKDLDKGNNLQQVAKGFVDSAEFKLISPSTDAKSLIDNFYLHVLHRNADDAGFKYWQDSMTNGMTASEVLVSFSESAENINNTAADIINGVWLV